MLNKNRLKIQNLGLWIFTGAALLSLPLCLSGEDTLKKAELREQTIHQLSTQKSSGQDEIERLVRLAALHLVEEPQQAWDYLSQASKLDADEADLHLYKASLLEAAHKINQAQKEYILAVKTDPKNPYYREFLADFYIRTKKYPEAVNVLEDAMSSPSLDIVWLKSIFWNKMAIPLEGNANQVAVPKGPLAPLVDYLVKLPSGVFWNETAFAKLPNKNTYLDQEQETYWLKLLSALKEHREETALEMIETNPFFTVSYAPELEKALKTILIFRNTPKEAIAPLPLTKKNQNVEQQFNEFIPMLAGLSELTPRQIVSAIPTDLRTTLMTIDALALPFLAYGWNEAALQLMAKEQLPDSYPQWVAVKFTEALKSNRGEAAAFEFAMQQPATAPLGLMIAEMAPKMNRNDAIISALMAVYKQQDEYGRKAALLLEPMMTDQGNYRMARSVIEAHPELVNSLMGKEILARIALRDSEPLKAAAIYREIEEESPEAKSYLAGKAFSEKDWGKARKLTEQLLVLYPGDEMLQQNLKKIEEEESKISSRSVRRS